MGHFELIWVDLIYLTEAIPVVVVSPLRPTTKVPLARRCARTGVKHGGCDRALANGFGTSRYAFFFPGLFGGSAFGFRLGLRCPPRVSPETKTEGQPSLCLRRKNYMCPRAFDLSSYPPPFD